MADKKKNQEAQFIVIGGVIITILVLAIIILVASKSSGKKAEENQQLSLGSNIKGQQVNTSGKFKDKKCKVSFSYPSYWKKSDIKLPLPQKPLSQVTFDEPATEDGKPKNSIFSFICYDSQEYSFKEFMGQNPFSKEETMSVGSLKWKRNGNFVYTIKNNRLIIFQMFFTKNDIKPISGYEELYLKIIKSVQLE